MSVHAVKMIQLVQTVGPRPCSYIRIHSVLCIDFLLLFNVMAIVFSVMCGTS